tara:strand:- start:936 stop:1070 length:135 start_codon:yes stop_codon:yes gene_type:complete
MFNISNKDGEVIFYDALANHTCSVTIHSMEKNNRIVVIGVKDLY